MMVLSQDNTYLFPNTVIKVTDTTGERTESTSTTYPIPKFNILIPTVQDIGATNQIELFYPGEINAYLKSHGQPNAIKYGFGPDLIHAILSNGASGVGVYTINLRGASANIANVITLMKYRVEEDVLYKSADNKQYYLSNGRAVTAEQWLAEHTDYEMPENPAEFDPVTAIGPAIKRDVLKIKFVNVSVNNCKKWTDVHTAMNSLYSDTVDSDGYKTIPVFGVMYKGASTFGNNVYFNLAARAAEYDGNIYYAVSLFDGVNSYTTEYNMSFDIMSGAEYNTTNYIETVFNANFETLRFLSYEGIEELYNIINPYLGTLEEYCAGIETPAKTFSSFDMFNANGFCIQIDKDNANDHSGVSSINIDNPKAFKLNLGTNGTETADALYAAFFNGSIIDDISSPLRYQFNYIPDMGYGDEVKNAIISLVKRRNRMTTATLMIGGLDSFSSALNDHQANYFEDMPNIRQIAAVQSPMRYNSFIHRTIVHPAIYFDTLGLVNNFVKWGNFYSPYAGSDARWTGYIEDTMKYPSENADYMNGLATSRINVVMKDAAPGGYMSDQMMNTIYVSDQTELNNALIVSSMLYDLVNLIHRNNCKFNEPSDVRQFKSTVDDVINTNYAQYSASLGVDVYRLGNVGRAKATNKIIVTVNMKDISKYAQVELILRDE